MKFKHLSVNGLFAALVLFPVAACGSNRGGPTTPSSPLSSSATPVPSPAPQTHANGRFTWTSIVSSRTLCAEITRQVGQNWPLWLSIVSNGDGVTLSLAEGPPDPFGDGPAIFTGTRNIDAISASRGLQNRGGMACPGDASITPEVGGELTATLAGNEISGQYSEVYGSGVSQVTFLFTFYASLVE